MNIESERDDLAAFGAAAENFCAVFERGGRGSREDFLFELAVALTSVYAASLRLPDWREERELQHPELSEESRHAMNTVWNLFQDDAFWDLVNFNAEPEERHFGVVFADELADIYAVLKTGLNLIATGEANEAVWHWRTTWLQWGGQIASELVTVHDCLVTLALARYAHYGTGNFPLPPEDQA